MCHNPPLTALEESGQNLSDLPRIRKEIAERDNPMVDEYGLDNYDDDDLYFQHNSIQFLCQHGECVIGIIDEYGKPYPIKENI
jgi:hypothetical protein